MELHVHQCLQPQLILPPVSQAPVGGCLHSPSPHSATLSPWPVTWTLLETNPLPPTLPPAIMRSASGFVAMVPHKTDALSAGVRAQVEFSATELSVDRTLWGVFSLRLVVKQPGGSWEAVIDLSLLACSAGASSRRSRPAQ